MPTKNFLISVFICFTLLQNQELWAQTGGETVVKQVKLLYHPIHMNAADNTIVLGETTLITYDAPRKGVVSAPEFELEVNGQKVFVWLIDFKILKSRYSKDTVRGKIENVRFKNITVEGDQFPYSQLLGFDETFRINGVSLENFVIQGTKVNSTYNGLITTIHADEILFK